MWLKPGCANYNRSRPPRHPLAARPGKDPFFSWPFYSLSHRPAPSSLAGTMRRRWRPPRPQDSAALQVVNDGHRRRPRQQLIALRCPHPVAAALAKVAMPQQGLHDQLNHLVPADAHKGIILIEQMKNKNSQTDVLGVRRPGTSARSQPAEVRRAAMRSVSSRKAPRPPSWARTTSAARTASSWASATATAQPTASKQARSFVSLPI